MDHNNALEKLCRVCGRTVTTKSVKTKYLCTNHLDDLERAFGISAQSDDPNTHPQHFCHSCKRVMAKVNPYYQHEIVVFEGWCSHTELACRVCQHYAIIQREGRPSKNPQTPGRPPSISPRYCMQHIRKVAPSPLVSPGDSISICKIHLSVPLSELKCPVCDNVLVSPVELVTCRNIVCAECLCTKLQQGGNLVCPCCNSNHLSDFTTIRIAPPTCDKGD